MIQEKFSITQNRLTPLGKKISIIKDVNGHEHIIPMWLTTGVIELRYEVSDNGKYRFDLSNYELNSLKENDIILVDVLRVEERVSEKGNQQKVFVVEYNRHILDVYFLDWQYCSIFKIPKQIELLIYKDRIQRIRFMQKISLQNQHPFFELEKECNLEFVSYLSGKSENGFLKLSDEFGGHYSVRAYYNQNYNDLNGQKIKCIFKGYDKYSNVLLVQAERKFITFKDVFKKENPFTDSVKNHFRNTAEYEEFQLQYANKDNRWLLTLVKVLNVSIDSVIENKHYELAVQSILVFIALENYIITSGYLSLFPHKSQDISKIARFHVEYYTSLLKPLKTLSKFNSEEYIYSCVEEIKSVEADPAIKENALDQIYLTLSLSFSEYFSVEFIVNLLEDLYKIFDNGFADKQQRKFYHYLKSKIHPLENPLFRKTFFNSKSKNLFYQHNKDLIAYFNLCNALAHFSSVYKSKEQLIWFAKGIRCISLYNSIENKSIEITQTLIDLLINNSDLKLLPLKYFPSLNYEDFPYLKPRISRENTFEWEQLKLIYSKKELLESEVVGEDIFGYYIKYHEYKGYVSSEFMREYEAAFFYFNNKSHKPKFSILSVDDFSKTFLIKYQKSKPELSRSKKLKEGDTVKGTVVSIVKFGAKILCGNIQGFVHKSEIDWGPVSYFDDFLTIGKEYEFKIISQRELGDHISYDLSLKQTYNDPWKTMWKNLDKTFDAIFLRRIDVNYLNDFHGLNIDLEKADVIETNCPRCLNIKHLEGTLTIDTVNKSWKCITPGCNFQGEEILLFRIISKKFNTAIPINELLENETKFAEENLERGDKVKLIIQSFDLSTRYSFSVFDKLEVYSNENVGIDYRAAKEDAIVIELAKTYEDLASLSKGSLQEVEFLQWAKHYYTIINNSKSYFYSIYILYLELINELKSFSNNEGVNKLDAFKNRISQLFSNAENLKTTTEIYKELNNHLQIFRYFLLLDDISFETNLFLLNENFNLKILNSTVKNFASIILSHNLLLSHKPNNISNLYTQTFNYLYSTLQEGKLSEINPSISEEDVVSDFENEKRNELLKLLNEGEGRNIEFKATLFTPIISAETTSLIQNFDERIKQASDKGELEKVKQLKLEKNGRCKIGTANDVKHSAIKEIAAFANTDGGFLIIGVRDNKEIIGLGEDFKKMSKEDKQDDFLTKFDDLVKDYLGENIQQLISHKFIKVNDKIVFLLTIKPNPNKKDPVLVKKNAEGNADSEFYTRAQGSVRKLSTLEIITYMNSFMN